MNLITYAASVAASIRAVISRKPANDPKDGRRIAAATALVPVLFHAQGHAGSWWAQATQAGAGHEALQLQVLGAATETMADFLAAMVSGNSKAASDVLKGFIDTAIEAGVVTV